MFLYCWLILGFVILDVFKFCSGSQFKTIVEYAPSQRVPKPCTRKDSREGTIYNGTFCSIYLTNFVFINVVMCNSIKYVSPALLLIM